MNSTIEQKPILKLAAKVEVSKSVRDQLAAAQARIEAADARGVSPQDINKLFLSASADYGSGKCSLLEAIARLGAGNSADAQREIRDSLMAGVKLEKGAAAESVRDSLIAVLDAEKEQVRALSQTLEGQERDAAEAGGIAADDFKPSEILSRYQATATNLTERIRRLRDSAIRISPSEVSAALDRV